mgnify:CR=1 FL=1
MEGEADKTALEVDETLESLDKQLVDRVEPLSGMIVRACMDSLGVGEDWRVDRLD